MRRAGAASAHDQSGQGSQREFRRAWDVSLVAWVLRYEKVFRATSARAIALRVRTEGSSHHH